MVERDRFRLSGNQQRREENPLPHCAGSSRRYIPPCSVQREKEKARFQAWKRKKMEEKSSPTFPSSSPSPTTPSPTPPCSRTTPWTNHRLPSLTNTPQLDGNLSVLLVEKKEEEEGDR